MSGHQCRFPPEFWQQVQEAAQQEGVNSLFMPNGASMDIDGNGDIIIDFPDFQAEVDFFKGNLFLDTLVDDDE